MAHLILSLCLTVALGGDFDDHYRKRIDPEQALIALREAKAQKGWRLSMSAYFVGLRVEKDPVKRSELYELGYRAGIDAVREESSCGRCAFWAAINLALKSEAGGPIAFLGANGEIQSLLKDSITYEPTYAGSGAHRLLGIIESKLPGIFGGSDERAEAHFRTAIAESPDEPLNYLFLGDFYMKKDEKKLAVKIYQQALTQTLPTSDRLESLEARAEILEKLKELDLKLLEIVKR